MLESLKHAGKSLGHEIGRGLESLSEGWREMLNRGSNALTHFSHDKDSCEEDNHALAAFPRWSLLAGEVEETDREIVVRVEVPGMDKDECRVTIEDDVLHVCGEKRIERETHDSIYHVMERAYGAFQRTIPLPVSVNIDKAEATCRNGVLTIRLPKEKRDEAKDIPVE